MLKVYNFPYHETFCVIYATRLQYNCKAKLFISICEEKKSGVTERKVPL